MLAGRLSDRLEDQLGLRLQAERTIRVRRIVIDHAEKPDANYARLTRPDDVPRTGNSRGLLPSGSNRFIAGTA